MLKMILELISNAFGVAKEWLGFKNSGVGQRKAAEGMVKSAEDAAKKRRAEINKAVHEGDAATVNRIVNGLAILWAMLVAASVLGCATQYSLGMVRDDVRSGDKALWRYNREQDARIQTLERRVYHLERGELLDHPAKGETK